VIPAPIRQMIPNMTVESRVPKRSTITPPGVPRLTPGAGWRIVCAKASLSSSPAWLNWKGPVPVTIEVPLRR
jgi:hypothetical protein